MVKINFFIVGAPKCGTTSIYEYLHDHPGICFSDSKEPNYFSYDFPGYRTTFSIEEYHEKEFSHCKAKTALLGEGSVWYLYSKVALREIYQYNPDAKIIVMLRNPVEMVYSLHSQMLYNLDEDIENFEIAWNLQKERSKGKNIPRWCRSSEFLLYREVAMYSAQLERLYEFFPENQVKVILFDDLVENPERVYLDILHFFDIESDHRKAFEAANSNKEVVFKPLAIFIQRPPKIVISIVSLLKKYLGVHRFGIYAMMDKLNQIVNTRKKKRKALSPQFKKMLLEEFLMDIDKTEKIIGRDLSNWKKLP